MRLTTCLLFAGVALFCAAAGAQPGASASTAAPGAPTKAEAPQDPLGRNTPRGTVLGFLLAERKGDNGTAARYLSTPLHDAAAADLAHKLYTVLDRRMTSGLGQLSDRPEGAMPFLTRPDQDRVATIIGTTGNVDIVVERVDRGSGGMVWLFSRETLRVIPGIYEELSGGVMESYVPSFLRETTIADVALFQWLALLVGLPAAYLLITYVARLAFRVAGMILRQLRKGADTPVPGFLFRPIRLLLLAMAVRWVLSKSNLHLLAREFWAGVATVLTIAACVWMVILINGVVEGIIRLRLESQHSEATSILRFFRRAVDLLVLVVGVLTGLHHFGVNMTAALAGFSVGGIAIALAAQKTLENVIGGISVALDKAVRVGDVVEVGDKRGTVEDIGLRSTRIRTADRTVVSIPNGQLAHVNLENFSIRDKFWFHHTLKLDYETSASMMREVLEGVERLSAQHPRIEHDSVRVRFVGFGTSSVDVEVFAYVLAVDWDRFLETQQELLLAVMDIVHAAGTRMACPPQTRQLDPSNAAEAPMPKGA